jgi:prevent-host-death family protein
VARPRLDEDIQPVTAFRAHAAALIARVRETRRALVLTQRGRGAAVLLDVREYERLLDELELLRDLQTAERQLARGEGVPHEAARRQVLDSLDE